jgi:hypothetical protein
MYQGRKPEDRCFFSICILHFIQLLGILAGYFGHGIFDYRGFLGCEFDSTLAPDAVCLFQSGIKRFPGRILIGLAQIITEKYRTDLSVRHLAFWTRTGSFRFAERWESGWEVGSTRKVPGPKKNGISFTTYVETSLLLFHKQAEAL